MTGEKMKETKRKGTGEMRGKGDKGLRGVKGIRGIRGMRGQGG